MPTISVFYGIWIQMFFRDHAPPHFHVTYAEHKAQINIETLAIIRGSLPRRAQTMVEEWGRQHQTSLMENWELCKQMQAPKKIPPLP
jgi:hypothetical protein